MDIGVPRELKDHEYRVAVTPVGVRELTAAGHRVLIEKGARPDRHAAGRAGQRPRPHGR